MTRLLSALEIPPPAARAQLAWSAPIRRFGQLALLALVAGLAGATVVLVQSQPFLAGLGLLVAALAGWAVWSRHRSLADQQIAGKARRERVRAADNRPGGRWDRSDGFVEVSAAITRDAIAAGREARSPIGDNVATLPSGNDGLKVTGKR